MKKTYLMPAILIILFTFFAACEKDESDSGDDVGGDQSPIGEVGNKFSISSSIGMEDLQAEITQVKDGISTISVTGKITDENIKQLAETIPNWSFGSYDASTGEFSGELRAKFNSEGIVDYLNVAGRPFTMVNFDANVGDTYTCEKANGGTFTRTVIARSNEDDFEYGFFFIKTITVEEAGRNPAINKIVYRFNHRFGLVHATVVLQDGSEIESYCYSVAEN